MQSLLPMIVAVSAIAAFMISVPVLAQSVQSAPNGDYALSTEPSHQLAPHWYEYHNWRSRDAYHTRLALHRELEHERNNERPKATHASNPTSATAHGGHTSVARIRNDERVQTSHPSVRGQ